MPRPFVQLDHVVLLLPYQDLVKPPDWIRDNFTVYPGGKHADGKTENRLIFFRDGTYLELIAFIHDDPARREGHWWDKDFGIVDLALTTKVPLEHEILNKRLKASGSEISYDKPRKGGRRSPDGKSIEWEVTFPSGVERGYVPFWCHDLTPRVLRVPGIDGNTRHPCGAIGIAGMSFDIPSDSFERIDKATAAITDLPRQANGEYEVGTPFDIGRLQHPTIRLTRQTGTAQGELRLTLVLQSPRKNGQKDIEERIGGGRVLIHFEV